MFQTGKKVTKRLKTGQTITITLQDEKSLRTAYDFLAGYSDRVAKTQEIEHKKSEVAVLQAAVSTFSSATTPIISSIPEMSPPSSPMNNGREDSSEVRFDTRSSNQIKLDAFYQASNELAELEKELASHNSITDAGISAKDIDSMLKKFGTSMNRRDIDYMIWEVDENADGKIDWDEFQLVYYRNVVDKTENEPTAFFHILEYLTYDFGFRGVISEDDCMEVLYSRHGLTILEDELRFLFGNRLRALGGDGVLPMKAYLEAVTTRAGLRSVVAD